MRSTYYCQAAEKASKQSKQPHISFFGFSQGLSSGGNTAGAWRFGGLGSAETSLCSCLMPDTRIDNG